MDLGCNGALLSREGLLVARSCFDGHARMRMRRKYGPKGERVWCREGAVGDAREDFAGCGADAAIDVDSAHQGRDQGHAREGKDLYTYTREISEKPSPSKIGSHLVLIERDADVWLAIGFKRDDIVDRGLKCAVLCLVDKPKIGEPYVVCYLYAYFCRARLMVGRPDSGAVVSIVVVSTVV